MVTCGTGEGWYKLGTGYCISGDIRTISRIFKG